MLGDVALDAIRDRVLVLRRMPQLAELDHDELALMAEHAHLVHARAGTVLLDENAALERIFMLVEGEAELTRKGIITTIVGPRLVGMLELSAGVDVAPRMMLTKNSLLLELPAEVVSAMLYEIPAIARGIVRLTAKNLLKTRSNLPAPLDAPEPTEGTWTERPLTTVERVLVLRRAPLWTRANLDALAELAKHIEEQRVPPGTVLWEIGDEADRTVRVEYGIVSCTNADGERVRVGAGFQLGALDSLAGQPRSYRAVTETKAILYSVAAATQMAVLEVHANLAARLRVQLSRALLKAGETPRS
ncbi:MAG: cyclic nucleotide-binding domain-containing protein [Myxococcales bacterium]|nr:cyclic nucleotide-binding domain-containing protein [Myxococcales bacterium]